MRAKYCRISTNENLGSKSGTPAVLHSAKVGPAGEAGGEEGGGDHGDEGGAGVPGLPGDGRG